MKSKIKHLIGSGAFLFLATLIVNIGNYGMNLLLGRYLGPAGFAEANVIATLVLVCSFMALGLQLSAAKFSAELKDNEHETKLASFENWLIKRTKIISILVAVLLLLLTPFLSEFLNFKHDLPLYILFAGIPSYFIMSVHRGLFQGKTEFNKMAFTYILELVGRVFGTIISLVVAYQFFPEYLTAAIAIGFLISFFTASILNAKPSKELVLTSLYNSRLFKKFFFVILGYEGSQILINNSDVLLVKHFFNDTEAGLYASIAVIGKIVFFATWTIVTLLFPKVIEKEKNGEDHTKLFWGALSLTAIVGIGITMSCYFFDEFFIITLFGNGYVSVAPLLWKYGFATCLFACANVFAYYHLSLGNYYPAMFSGIAGVIQFIILIYFHQSLETIIVVQIFSMALLMIAMISYHLAITRIKSNNHLIKIKTVLS